MSSLRQPGGNLTGINVQTVEIFGKRLQLLRAMLPKVSRVAFIWNTQTGKAQLEAAQQAAQKLGVKLQGIEVSTPEALPGAFEAAVKGRAEALMFMSSGFMFGLRAQITALALKHRLPASYGNTASVEAGGLMNYGPNDTEYYRQAAVFVDKIFKGARPADLPVEQPLKWELVINMKTAKALGITVPQALLLQATRMIE